MKGKLLGQFWHECARCGFTFPESMLAKNKKGKWICLKYCWDPEDGQSEER